MRLIVSLLVVAVTVLLTWTLVAAATPAARPNPVELGRVYLVSEVVLLRDGTSRVVGNQVLRTSRDAVELAKRLAALETEEAAGLKTPGEETPNDHPEQCSAIAFSTKMRCRNPNGGNPSGLCPMHRVKSEHPFTGAP
jgi:hypothetical protein